MLAIALLALFGFAFVSPLLALSEGMESNVPMCCRKGGQHHCMAGMQGAGQDALGLRGPMERCPYCPATVAAQVHGAEFRPSTAAAIYAGVVAHPAVVAQSECRLRMAKVGARGLRGPPVLAGL